jgi:hypothetical protein
LLLQVASYFLGSLYEGTHHFIVLWVSVHIVLGVFQVTYLLLHVFVLGNLRELFETALQELGGLDEASLIGSGDFLFSEFVSEVEGFLEVVGVEGLTELVEFVLHLVDLGLLLLRQGHLLGSLHCSLLSNFLLFFLVLVHRGLHLQGFGSDIVDSHLHLFLLGSQGVGRGGIGDRSYRSGVGSESTSGRDISGHLGVSRLDVVNESLLLLRGVVGGLDLIDLLLLFLLQILQTHLLSLDLSLSL